MSSAAAASPDPAEDYAQLIDQIDNSAAFLHGQASSLATQIDAISAALNAEAQALEAYIIEVWDTLLLAGQEYADMEANFQQMQTQFAERAKYLTPAMVARLRSAKQHLDAMANDFKLANAKLQQVQQVQKGLKLLRTNLSESMETDRWIYKKRQRQASLSAHGESQIVDAVNDIASRFALDQVPPGVLPDDAAKEFYNVVNSYIRGTIAGMFQRNASDADVQAWLADPATRDFVYNSLRQRLFDAYKQLVSEDEKSALRSLGAGVLIVPTGGSTVAHPADWNTQKWLNMFLASPPPPPPSTALTVPQGGSGTVASAPWEGTRFMKRFQVPQSKSAAPLPPPTIPITQDIPAKHLFSGPNLSAGSFGLLQPRSGREIGAPAGESILPSTLLQRMRFTRKLYRPDLPSLGGRNEPPFTPSDWGYIPFRWRHHGNGVRTVIVPGGWTEAALLEAHRKGDYYTGNAPPPVLPPDVTNEPFGIDTVKRVQRKYAERQTNVVDRSKRTRDFISSATKKLGAVQSALKKFSSYS